MRAPNDHTRRRRPAIEAHYPTADDIAALAHELFIAGGRRVGKIPEYWRTAESELLERAARRVLGFRPK